MGGRYPDRDALPEHLKKLNPHLFKDDEPSPIPDRRMRPIDMPEDVLQELCEQELVNGGYFRLKAANAELAVGRRPRGWFGHLSECQRNPLMPDVFVFHPDRPPLLVELKKAKPKYQPGQLEMIQCGYWLLARSVTEFKQILKTWEGEAQ